MERIDFKKNVKNLHFKSAELRHWQALFGDILHYVLGEKSELEVKSPQEVMTGKMVGVYSCESYRTCESCWFRHIVK